MRTLLSPVALLLPTVLLAQSPAQPVPIIDVHLHAHPIDPSNPPAPVHCAEVVYPPLDPGREEYDYLRMVSNCANPLKTPSSTEAMTEQTLEILRRRNIIAVASGTPSLVEQWTELAPEHVIPAWDFFHPDQLPLEKLRAALEAGRIQMLGEIATEYGGIAPNDPALDPYYALAEEHDIPVAIHMGLGPPGAMYLVPSYRVRYNDPLLLEEVLHEHPKMRVLVMHAGWPMMDRMISLMWSYPQVYVDLGVIDWAIPREEFYASLQRLVDAGFGKRILFGSDQMHWPEAIELAIERIESAEFLTQEQKRDILYNNAARFLRLEERTP